MIATLGPLFGFAAVLAWAFVGRSTESALYLMQFPDVVILPYAIGGGPAAIAGLLAAWRVWQRGSITPLFWLIATAVLAFVPSLTFLALSRPSAMGALYVTDEEIAVMYIAATAFASLTLWLLLTVTGLLRGPSEA
jgi:hypothetical protein